MPRRVLQGTVVSDKNDKTVTVLVERRVMHPVYKKFIKQSKKYAAHDETNVCKVGQTVFIQECRPVSKMKRWAVVPVSSVEKAGALRSADTHEAEEAAAAT